MLIGVVGLQLAASPTSPVARILPFYGPRPLIAAGLKSNGAIAGPLLLTIAYAYSSARRRAIRHCAACRRDSPFSGSHSRRPPRHVSRIWATAMTGDIGTSDPGTDTGEPGCTGPMIMVCSSLTGVGRDSASVV